MAKCAVAKEHVPLNNPFLVRNESVLNFINHARRSVVYFWFYAVPFKKYNLF